MNASYWRGVGLGLALFGPAVGIAIWMYNPRLSSIPQTPLIFDPGYYNLSEQCILPNDSCRFEAVLRNNCNTEVLIDGLRFSCTCATGVIGDQLYLPVRLSGHQSLPVKITVKSEKGESGPLELQFGVIGRIGPQRVEAGASAALTFAQALNCEPNFLSLGQVAASSLIQKEILLWGPAEFGSPDEILAESNDPCVAVEVRPLEDVPNTKTGRLNLAKLLVTIDPLKAPERLSAYIAAKADRGEVRIPVFGFFGEDSRSASLP